MSVEEFHGLIATLMSPDNNARSQAEAAFNSMKEANPVAVLSFLSQTIRHCTQEALRAFAAVLFRRSCPELWRHAAVDAGTKGAIKQLMLQSIQEVRRRPSPRNVENYVNPSLSRKYLNSINVNMIFRIIQG